MGKVCNIVEFTNNRDAVTPTGIVMSFAPYILLVALAVSTIVYATVDGIPVICTDFACGRLTFTSALPLVPKSTVLFSVASQSFSKATRYLDVYVTRPEGATACSIANYELTKADGTGKNGGYTNTYKTYALDLTKTVTGDMGESNRPFEFTITFTGPENTSFALED